MRNYDLTKDELRYELYSVDENEIVRLINDECSHDDNIHPMALFEDIESGSTKLETIERWVRGSRYNNTNDADNNSSDPYFAYNGRGNITTIESSNLVNWLLENINDTAPIIDFLYDNGFIEETEED